MGLTDVFDFVQGLGSGDLVSLFGTRIRLIRHMVTRVIPNIDIPPKFR